MFWPIVLPAEITFWLFVALVGFLTICAPAWKWKRSRTFVTSLSLAFLLFVPSCIGIMEIVDRFRFGTFQYASFSDVKDFRVERYMPTTATNITLRKYPSGHMAMYSISESDLKDYIDDLWKKFGEYSAISREDLDKHISQNPTRFKGEPLSPSNYEPKFQWVGWQEPENLIERHSPKESDGGGAVYFYDPATQTAYHRGSYW